MDIETVTQFRSNLFYFSIGTALFVESLTPVIKTGLPALTTFAVRVIKDVETYRESYIMDLNYFFDEYLYNNFMAHSSDPGS